MGINTGAFIAPLVCGWFAQSEQFRGILGSLGFAPESSWHWGFAMAAIGMFFGLVQYLGGLEAPGRPRACIPPRRSRRRRRRRSGGCSGWGSRWSSARAVLLWALSAAGVVRITAQGVSNALGLVLLITTVAFFGWMFLAAKWTTEERKRLVVVLVLFVAAMIFWSVFEQAGSTLNLFAQRDTRTEAFGLPFPSSWLQSVAPFLLVVLSPGVRLDLVAPRASAIPPARPSSPSAWCACR